MQEKYFGLFIIPIVELHIMYLTIPDLNFNINMVMVFAFYTSIGYIIWYFNRFLIFSLDNVFPLERNIIARIILQTIIITTVSLAIIIIFISTVNFLIKDFDAITKYSTTTHFSSTLLVCLMYIGFGNVYVISYYFWQKHNVKSTHIFYKGKSKILIKEEDIYYIYYLNKITYVINKDLQQFTSFQSLNSLENKLNPHSFFRANRQYLISRPSIVSFKAGKNGKIECELVHKEPGDVIVTVSRVKAKKFKSWLQTEIL